MLCYPHMSAWQVDGAGWGERWRQPGAVEGVDTLWHTVAHEAEARVSGATFLLKNARQRDMVSDGRQRPGVCWSRDRACRESREV